MARKRTGIGVPPPAEMPSAEVIDVRAVLESYLKGEIDLICVLGPTASGKTRYAVSLCREINEILSQEDPAMDPKAGAEILSADSRQVYRGMDIGTGKDIAEYGSVPYHLIDIADPGDGYNVHRFTEDFAAAFADIRNRGCIPILCGGTGLYINAVTAGYDFENRQPLSAERTVTKAPKTFFIGTLVSRDVRNARIDARLDARLKEGMIEEIRGLLHDGVPKETLIAYGLEYKFVTQYVLGEISYDFMKEHLGIAIHQFAKRQMTWFRGMERRGFTIHWVDATKPMDEKVAQCLEIIGK